MEAWTEDSGQTTQGNGEGFMEMTFDLGLEDLVGIWQMEEEKERHSGKRTQQKQRLRGDDARVKGVKCQHKNLDILW